MKSIAENSFDGRVTNEVAPREFRMAPELRRASYIVVWGLSFCILVGIVLAFVFDDERVRQDSFIAALAACTVVSVLTWWVNHFKYRVDECGVHRRILFRWQTWSWDVFSAGNVLRGKGRFSFVFPGLSFSRRKLSFALIGDENAEWVLAECLKYWETPVPPAAPDHIELKPGAPIMWLFTSRRIYADTKGLILTDRAASKAHAWRDVRRCVFFRPSHEHDSFVELRLELPGENVVLAVDTQNDIKQWMGSKPEIVSEFIKQHVSPERVVNASLTGPAQSIAEVDVRIERIERAIAEYKKVARLSAVFLPTLLCVYVWYIWPNNFRDAFTVWGSIGGVAVLVFLVGLQYGGTIFFVRRGFGDSLAELRTQRNALASSENALGESSD